MQRGSGETCEGGRTPMASSVSIWETMRITSRTWLGLGLRVEG